MNFNREYEMRPDSIKNKCTCYLFFDAILVLDDGKMVNGIIEKVDDDNVGMLVAEDMQIDEENPMNTPANNAMNNPMNNNSMNMNSNMSRQPRPGFGGYNRYRRYGRRNYPINRINRVGLVPFPIIPPIYPPYPIYSYPYPPILPI